MRSPVCRHVTPGETRTWAQTVLYGAVLEEMGILWASNCTRPSVTSLMDVPSDSGLDSNSLAAVLYFMYFRLRVLQHILFPPP